MNTVTGDLESKAVSRGVAAMALYNTVKDEGYTYEDSHWTVSMLTFDDAFSTAEIEGWLREGSGVSLPFVIATVMMNNDKSVWESKGRSVSRQLFAEIIKYRKLIMTTQGMNARNSTNANLLMLALCLPAEVQYDVDFTKLESVMKKYGLDDIQLFISKGGSVLMLTDSLDSDIDMSLLMSMLTGVSV